MAAYFLVNKETNIVENIVEWDGNTDNWQPPETYLALPVETTPASDWTWDHINEKWVEVESAGNGGIGDSWNGTRLIEEQPAKPPIDDPVADAEISSGTQEL